MNAGGCADPGGCEDADKHLYEYQHHELTPTSISASGPSRCVWALSGVVPRGRDHSP